MKWTVTFFRGDDRLSLIGTEEYDFKREAVAAVYRQGKPRSIHRVRRAYSVVLRERR